MAANGFALVLALRLRFALSFCFDVKRFEHKMHRVVWSSAALTVAIVVALGQ